MKVSIRYELNLYPRGSDGDKVGVSEADFSDPYSFYFILSFSAMENLTIGHSFAREDS